MSEAAESVVNDKKPTVDVRPGTGFNSSTWTVYNCSTNEEAVLVHAAIWNSNTPLDTGNFVPPGEKAPRSVTEGRVQKKVSYMCDVSYTLDTTLDESLWDNLEALEAYVQKQEDFNRSERDRAQYQDGSRRTMYNMTSKLFWLTRGIDAQKRPEYVINPNKPSYYDLVENVPVRLDHAKPSYFRRGDIIWFAFKLCFFVGRESWSSEIIPLEFLRVARREGLYSSSPDDDNYLSGEEGEDDTDTTPLPRLAEGQAIRTISRKSQTAIVINPEYMTSADTGTKDENGNQKRRNDDNGSDADTLASRSSSGDDRNSGSEGGTLNGTEGDAEEPDVIMEEPPRKRLRKARS
ncbi:hypothetical protein CVT26_004160 [Gymnopilus dilepis]|uniref:Uncharacterized protein n=1 Tax=Gymnopilus dilepis TaxID=231916 RepID=A0A409WN57_9AGAR|nr:hypothetical protein CVT26_004160 [Gymnopilus dilepis]